jgi:feruloyl esterase
MNLSTDPPAAISMRGHVHIHRVLDIADGAMGLNLSRCSNRFMEWVEHGRPPEAVDSENWDQAGVTTRTRPLCPYPEYARYRGRGSLDDAANFRCQK